MDLGQTSTNFFYYLTLSLNKEKEIYEDIVLESEKRKNTFYQFIVFQQNYYKIKYKLYAQDDECFLSLKARRIDIGDNEWKRSGDEEDQLWEYKEILKEKQLKFIFEKITPTDVNPSMMPISCFYRLKYFVGCILAPYITVISFLIFL
jgi:hypothetical protein